MHSPTVADVDLGALAENFRVLARLLATEAGTTSRGRPPRIIAVVKANAYGHGATVVGPVLERAGAAMLACADIEEGMALRDAGVTIPILVFGALGVSALDSLFTHRLTPTVSTPGAGRALQAAAAVRGVRVSCHLKIDTGMNRLGLRFDNLARTAAEIAGHSNLVVDAVYTHFATADQMDDEFFDEQRRRFEEALGVLARVGIRPRWRHAAGSAALLRDARVWYDAVRPGLLLYGVVPPPLATTLPLRPVLTLRSRLVAVKGVRPGEGIGYGLTARATAPRTLGIVPAGYADGLDRRLGNRGVALVGGRRVPIVGAVSMDMLAIDVTGLAVAPGDEVVLLGEQQGAVIDAREVAATIGTIPYEVLCRLGSRIQRVYHDVPA